MQWSWTGDLGVLDAKVEDGRLRWNDYPNAFERIAGALDAGAGSKPEGIEALKKLVSGSPKDAEIVIYCGCCPMDKCPNIRPAYRALKEAGYTRIRVLNIPTNMSTDWYSKNYPSEPGTPASKP